MIKKVLIVNGFSFCLMSCGQEMAVIKMEAPSVTPSENLGDQLATPTEQPATPTKIFIHVCGAVNKPGVYEMLAGNRIFEAIELAGGFTDEASQIAVNLADEIVDGQQVFVPTNEEAIKMPNQAMTAVSEEQSLININTADVTKLQELNGIGEAKAKEILMYREKNGAFNSVEDIKNVSGIGEKLYERIKENITVD